MSHDATNWAIKQRGLKPTTKIVLWHLCDRFNPDYGCFPSQDRLAHDCEISRSTLNQHLAHLETAGLLRRVPRLDPVTKRQLPTRYILGFEPGFAPKPVPPCPDSGRGSDLAGDDSIGAGELPFDRAFDADPCAESGHGQPARPVSDFCAEPCPDFGQSRVRNPDTNLVREPLSKPVKEEEDAQAREAGFDRFFGQLLAALGLDPSALPGWWQGWPPRVHVQRWRDELGLTHAEILAVAEASRIEHPTPPDGPKALDRAMQRAAGRKRIEAAKPARGKARGGGGSGGSGGAGGSGGGNGGAGGAAAPAPAPITDLPTFYADLINSDRFVPVTGITNTIRDAMLARGLVTADRLRMRGVR